MNLLDSSQILVFDNNLGYLYLNILFLKLVHLSIVDIFKLSQFIYSLLHVEVLICYI